MKKEKGGKNTEVESVKYSCNFSNKNLTTKDLKKSIDENMNTLKNAMILDISNNKIDKIILRRFNEISILKASNNIIKEIDINLTRITLLDLSHNKIIKFPNLTSMPLLEIIMVNNNYIEDFIFDYISEFHQLRVLNLANNNIKFKQVHDFLNLIEGIEEITMNFQSLSVLDNPFTHREIYKDCYYDYVINVITTMIELNHKSTKRRPNKSIANNMRGTMIEKENLEKSKVNSLEVVVDLFEKAKYDESTFLSKFEDVIKAQLNVYTDKINSATLPKGEEFDHTDKDSVDFERLVNLCKTSIEIFPNFDRHIINIFVSFSSIRKGKWANQCFNFLKHLSDRNESLKSQMENELYIQYKDLFGKLSSIDNKQENKNVNDSILDHFPLVIKGIKYFTNSAYPKLITMVYESVLLLYNNEVFNFNMIFNQLDQESTPEQVAYDNKLKYYLFKYTLQIIRNCYSSKSRMFLKEHIKEADIYSLFYVFLLFFEKIEVKNVYETFDMIRFQKIFQKITCIIKAVLKFYPQDKLRVIISNIKKNKKYDYINKIMSYINNYYMTGRYRLYTIDKVLLKRDEIQLKYFENLTLSCLMKILLHSVILFENEIIRHLNNIIGLIMNTLRFNEEVINTINMEYDPILMEIANYTIMILLRNNSVLWNKKEFITFVINIKENFKNILLGLNEDEKVYKNACKINHIYNYYEIGSNNKGIPSLAYNSSKLIMKVFDSILNILIYLGNEGKYQVDKEINKLCVNINADLNAHNRDDYLIKCLTVPSDKIKTKVITCFLSIRYDELSSKEIGGLLTTISNSNWLEARMEKIIADTFMFILRLFHDNFLKNNNLPLNNSHVIEIGLKIIQKNTERTNFTEEDMFRIELLNIAVITLLINLSGYQNYVTVFDHNHYVDFVKKTLINEFKSVKSNSLFPLEVEKCFLGWKVSNIKSFFALDGLKPYNYVSLRVLIHLANVLMNVPYSTLNIYRDVQLSEISGEILNEFKSREINRIMFECYTWKRLDQVIQKENTESLNELQLNKDGLDISNLFANIFSQDTPRLNEKIFLTPKMHGEQINEFVLNFKFFLDWIIGDTSSFGKTELTEKLIREKFDPQIIDFDKVNFRNIQNQTNEENERLDKLNNNINNDLILSRDITEFTKFILRTHEDDINSHKKSSLSFQHIQNDLLTFDYYGSSIENISRKENEETVDNSYLRCLTITAFLRCINSVLEYKVPRFGKFNPVDKLKELLRTQDILQRLILLIDCTKLNHCNISTKLLIILRKIFQNLSKEVAVDNVLEIERIIILGSLMIAKVMVIIKDTAKYDDDYNELVNAIVICCLTISNEINFISLDEKIKIQLINKILTSEVMNILIRTMVGMMDHDNKRLMNSSLNRQELEYNMLSVHTFYLLSEYMCLHKENAYTIIETFYKQININKYYVRKTFINDLMETYKLVKMKNSIKFLDRSEKIIFVTDCLFLDYERSVLDIKFLVVTTERIIFTDYTDKYLTDNFDFRNINLEVDERWCFRIDKIAKIYTMEFKNRLFITIHKDMSISLLFKKIMTSKVLLNTLLSLNKSISVVESTRVLYGDDENVTIDKGSSQEEEKTNDIINIENDNKKSQSANINNNSVVGDRSKKEKFNELKNKKLKSMKMIKEEFLKNKLKKLEEDKTENNQEIQNKPPIINKNIDNKTSEMQINICLVSLETQKLCDCFNTENKFVKNPKIFHFTDKKLYIYQENYEKLQHLKVEDIYMKKGLLGHLSSIYEKYDVYELSDIEELTFISPNIINIKFAYSYLKVYFLDDWSYYIIRSILIDVCKQKNFQKTDTKI